MAVTILGCGLWLATLLFVIGNQRALVWAAVLGSSYVITSAYALAVMHYSLVAVPWPQVVSFMIDAGISVLILTYRKDVWERALNIVLLLSVLPHIPALVGFLEPLTYAVTMELFNVAMMAILWFGRLGRNLSEIPGGRRASSAIRRLVVAACARGSFGVPWTKKPR